MEHYDVVPDITTFAKSVAGGVPLSGLCGRTEIMDAAGYGGLGGTYAGNALAIAAAHAVLEIIDEERLCARAASLGKLVSERLSALADEIEEIGEVRALGSMVAVEFVDPRTRKPNPGFTRRVHARTFEAGLLILVCGLNNNVIRFLHPLTTPDAIMHEGLDMFTAAVRAAAAEHGAKPAEGTAR
jgi:4-aminobutyrate aminotransferase